MAALWRRYEEFWSSAGSLMALIRLRIFAAKAPSGIYRSIWAVTWSDCVVPRPVEFGADDVQRRHLLIRDDDALGIEIGVEFATHRQAGISRGRADQIDNDTIADQGLGSPIHADEREQTMLDLVPLAGARWQVMDGDVN